MAGGEVMRDKDETARGLHCSVCFRRHAPASGLSDCERAALDAAAAGQYTGPDFEPSAKILEIMRDPEAYQAAAELRAAKERLGAWWLADYAKRGAYFEQKKHGTWFVFLFVSGEEVARGAGPTEAAAILAALEKVGG